MPGPVQSIHVFLTNYKDGDGRDKPGHDEASPAIGRKWPEVPEGSKMNFG
jgi:hypothetical protein